jgi:hypothetical protein
VATSIFNSLFHGIYRTSMASEGHTADLSRCPSISSPGTTYHSMLHEELFSKPDVRLDSLDSDVSGNSRCHASCSHAPQSLLKSETSNTQLFYSPSVSPLTSTHPEGFNHRSSCMAPRHLVASPDQVQRQVLPEERTNLGPIVNVPSDLVSFLDC